MRIVRKECEDGRIRCFVMSVIRGGPADVNNINVGKNLQLTRMIELNGKINCKTK